MYLKIDCKQDIFSVKYIVFTIFEYVDIKSLGRMGQLNKTLNRYFNEDFIWKKKIANPVIILDDNNYSYIEIYKKYHSKENKYRFRIDLQINNEIKNFSLKKFFPQLKFVENDNKYCYILVKNGHVHLCTTKIGFFKKFEIDEENEINFVIDGNFSLLQISICKSNENNYFYYPIEDSKITDLKEKENSLLNVREVVDRNDDKYLNICHEKIVFENFRSNHFASISALDDLELSISKLFLFTLNFYIDKSNRERKTDVVIEEKILFKEKNLW